MTEIIAVYGANGAGKTTVAVNLAYTLAQKKNKLVGIMCTDFSYPSLQSFLCMEINDNDSSFAQIFSAAHTIEYQQMFVQHSAYNKLFVLSIPNSTDCLRFAAETKFEDLAVVKSFYSELKNSNFDYVIVDCSNDVNNLLSTWSIHSANKIIHLVKPTVQGVCFFKAYNTFLNKMRNLHDSPILNVANGDMNYVGIGQIEKHIGLTFDLCIPYDVNVAKCENEGVPIMSTGAAHSLFKKDTFNNGMNRLIDVILKSVDKKDGEVEVNA
ncbi:MAG: AAA family ATPase [Clostridiales bacterium]|nr:AAA family ATPase [Clostridiales bacterium]